MLAGWRGSPPGRIERGPVPASFDALVAGGHATLDQLQKFTDRVLHITPGLAPSAFLRNGHLRPFVLHVAATLIMYYPETAASGEVPYVPIAMLDGIAYVGLAGGGAHATLLRWGTTLAAAFATDNLHMTSDAGSGQAGMESLVRAIQQGSAVAAADQQRVNTELAAVKAELIVTQGLFTALTRSMAAAPRPATPHRTAAVAGTNGAAAAAAGSLARADSAAVAFDASLGDVGEEDVVAANASMPMGSGAADASAVLSSPGLGAAPASTAGQAWGSLRTAPAGTVTAGGLKGILATEVYIAAKAGRPFDLGQQNNLRLRTTCSSFNMVATKEQHAILSATGLARDELAVARTGKDVQHALIARLIHEWASIEQEVPAKLSSYASLTVNAVSDHIKGLKKANGDDKSVAARLTAIPLTDELRAVLQQHVAAALAPKAAASAAPAAPLSRKEAKQAALKRKQEPPSTAAAAAAATPAASSGGAERPFKKARPTAAAAAAVSSGAPTASASTAVVASAAEPAELEPPSTAAAAAAATPAASSGDIVRPLKTAKQIAAAAMAAAAAAAASSAPAASASTAVVASTTAVVASAAGPAGQGSAAAAATGGGGSVSKWVGPLSGWAFPRRF